MFLRRIVQVYQLCNLLFWLFRGVFFSVISCFWEFGENASALLLNCGMLSLWAVWVSWALLVSPVITILTQDTWEFWRLEWRPQRWKLVISLWRLIKTSLWSHDTVPFANHAYTAKGRENSRAPRENAIFLVSQVTFVPFLDWRHQLIKTNISFLEAFISSFDHRFPWWWHASLCVNFLNSLINWNGLFTLFKFVLCKFQGLQK